MKIPRAVLFTLTALPLVALADDVLTGPRSITLVGCMLEAGQCYVSVSGEPTGGTFGCSSTSIRWNADNTASGKRWLALLYGAYLAGKKVNFAIDGCFPDWPTFPTFRWANVQD